MKSICFLRKVSNALQRNNFASISFSKFGEPSVVCKVSDSNVNQASSGIEVAIKVSQVSIDDIRNVKGLSLNRCNTGVAGETAVGNLPTGESVFVVGQGYGTWRTSGVFPETSIFKIPSLSLQQSAQLSSAVLAYGILTKFANLSKGDIVLHNNKPSSVATALSKLSKHMGYTPVTVSLADLSTHEGLSKLKASGNIKLIAATNDSHWIKALYKAAGKDGCIVLYNDTIETLSDIDGLHLGVSHSIFDNVSISGLNIKSWASSEPLDFQAALTNVSKLIAENVITPATPTSILPHTEFAKAVEIVKEGKNAFLTF